MKFPILILSSLGALALGACGGGGKGGGSSTPPPSGSTNSAPTISGLSVEQKVLQDGSSNPIPFDIGDAEASADELTVSVSSSNAALLSAQGIEISGNGASRSLLLLPESGQSGKSDVTVSVTDDGGMTTTQKLALEVTTKEQSFRDFAVASLDAAPEAEPAEVTGNSWTETEEDNPAAFDSVLSSIND